MQAMHLLAQGCITGNVADLRETTMQILDQTGDRIWSATARKRYARDFARQVVPPADVDALEVAACVQGDDGDVERIDWSDETASFYTVYWHVPGEGADAFADLITQDEAESLANFLASLLGVEVHVFVA